MPDAGDFVLFTDLDTADDFLNELILRNPRWSGVAHDSWCFRGQAKAEWDLQPSVFRDDIQLPLGPGSPKGPQQTHYDQVCTEYMLLAAFVRYANQQGLTLPSIADRFWDDPAGIFNQMEIAAIGYGPHDWPVPQWMPLFALAQHHGLPTRLLDWSLDPKIAAYFAARSALDHLERGDNGFRVAVWAYRHEATQDWRIWRMQNQRERPHLIHTPAGANRNLHAQWGVFTTVLRRAKREDPPATSPLNVLLADVVTNADAEWLETHAKYAPVMQKLTLPVSEAPKLLRILSSERIDGNTLFPGFDGVVRGIKERVYWDRWEALPQ